MEASVAAPGQGAPAAGAQPGAPGQGGAQGQPTAAGQGDGQQQGQFNWGLFPDVPEAQREIMEPHLRGVQGHVTKIEQQYAPYKGLVDAVSPEQVTNLVGFLNAYNTDPVATAMGMIQELQQNGKLPANTVETLQQLQQGAAPPAGQQAQPGQEQDPMAQQLAQLQSRLDQQDAQRQQAQQAEQQAQQEAANAEALQTAKTNIRGTLTTAGIEEGLVTDEMIVSAIIAHNGDEQGAANMLTAMRDNFLGAFAKQNGGGVKPPNVQGNLPQPQKAGGRKGDPFADAKTGARQLLEQRAAAAAQE